MKKGGGRSSWAIERHGRCGSDGGWGGGGCGYGGGGGEGVHCGGGRRGGGYSVHYVCGADIVHLFTTPRLRAAKIPRRSCGAASVELRVWRSCVLVAEVPWGCLEQWVSPRLTRAHGFASRLCSESALPDVAPAYRASGRPRNVMSSMVEDASGRGWLRVAGGHAERASTGRAHRHPRQEQPLHGGRHARQRRGSGGP